MVWIFFSQKSQTLYDKITSTLVLRKSNESFLPSFLPNSVHRFHWIIVIVFSLSMAFFAMRATVVVMMPRVDLITLKVMINESLKDLSPAQRVIEEAILKNGKPPETIDASLFSRTANRRHIYLAGNGNITVLFSQGSLNGRGLIISPAQDQKTKEIIWWCAAINLPAELTPNSCAPTPVPVAKRGI